MTRDTPHERFEKSLDKSRKILKILLEKLILISPLNKSYSLHQLLSQSCADGDLKSKITKLGYTVGLLYVCCGHHQRSPKKANVRILLKTYEV